MPTVSMKKYACKVDGRKMCWLAVAGNPFVAHLLQGFNVTLFAYGQTASGKTHTMTGNLRDRNQVQESHCHSCTCLSAGC